MIDPKQVTNFNRTEAELQEFLLFCIVVAGKNAHQQARKLDEFLNTYGHCYRPFGVLEAMIRDNALLLFLKSAKIGQYTRISKAFKQVAELTDLKNISVAELEKVKGIGPKTARFFVMHSRPNQRVAVLDTHILKWLRSQLVAAIPVPKTTPNGKRYAFLENCFLELAFDMGKTPAELDLEIWKSYAKA